MIRRKEKILELRSQGLSYREIKNLTGASLSVISFHCAPDQKEKVAQRTRDKRSVNRKYIQEIKSSQPCTDCKEKYPYFVMEFDHVQGDKISDLSKLAKNGTLDAVKAEIDKCEVVCSNCHKFRTWNRLLKGQGDVFDFILE